MNIEINPSSGYLIIILLFAILFIVTIVFATRYGTKSITGFLVADRRIPWWLGGTSSAASWTWAIALMVSVQMAYENGFSGSFWFILPNILAVLVFIWLAPRLRERLPTGFSFPEWIQDRLKSRSALAIYLIVFGFYQVMAVTVQIFAGSNLVSAATGISAYTLMPLLLAITLAYCLVSGLEASVVTDFLQFTLMLIVGGALVYLTVNAADGRMHFSGTNPGTSLNPFSPRLMFTAGFVTSVGLLSGAIADQQLWQRALALRERDVKKSFLFAALLFAIIPISLSLLGYVAAAPENGVVLAEGTDPSLVTFSVVDQLLPGWAAAAFLLVLLAGMASTLDSGLVAWSSLWRSVREELPARAGENGAELNIWQARRAMLFVGLLGLGLAYVVQSVPTFELKYLWWFMNTMGTSVAIPTVLSLVWPRLTAKAVVVGSGGGLLVGLPMIGYASINQMDILLSVAYAAILVISGASCWLFRNREPIGRVA